MSVHSTGHHYEVGPDVNKIPEYNPISQEHYWVMLAGFVVNPKSWPEDEPFRLHMDMENLVLAGAIGCYHCEAPYEKRLVHRRCPGEPRDDD